MTTRMAIAALSALALVAGCGRAGQSTNDASLNSPVTANAAAPQKAQGVDRAFLIGSWTPDGDCSNPFTFAADGTTLVTGGKTARWELDEPFITVTPPGEPVQRSPIARTGEKLVLQGEGGRVMTLSRCPANAPVAPPTQAAGQAAE